MMEVISFEVRVKDLMVSTVSSNVETANAVLTKFIGKTVPQGRCCIVERSCDLKMRLYSVVQTEK